MEPQPDIPAARDKLLFTPGPLTTSLPVKQAMLHDAGSWHWDFNNVVRRIRGELLDWAGLGAEAGFDSILMQGSGSFGVEAVLASLIPPDGKLLLMPNGAYGERILQMAQYMKIPHHVLRSPEDQTPDPAAVDAVLAEDASITHAALVHCETTTGILNPLEPIGEVVRNRNRVFIVDAMSSFGGMPIDFRKAAIDFLVSSANKCLEGVPGFSFVIGRRSLLDASEGWARSLSLDLLSQLRGFEKNGQFRYTPPTHAILAFARALEELKAEGGIPARTARYQANHNKLVEGMKALGFRPYLHPSVQSHIITSFHFLRDPKFSFNDFYRFLSDEGFIIYPGKISQADTFRVGSIGRIFPADIASLLAAVGRAMEELKLKGDEPA